MWASVRVTWKHPTSPTAGPHPTDLLDGPLQMDWRQDVRVLASCHALDRGSNHRTHLHICVHTDAPCTFVNSLLGASSFSPWFLWLPPHSFLELHTNFSRGTSLPSAECSGLLSLSGFLGYKVLSVGQLNSKVPWSSEAYGPIYQNPYP